MTAPAIEWTDVTCNPTAGDRISPGCDHCFALTLAKCVKAVVAAVDLADRPARVMAAKFEVPDGWVLQAYQYALDPTGTHTAMLESHAGGARFAYNTMLRAVKAKLSLSERLYVCDNEHCGLEIDRDLNAAINLARLARAEQSACFDSGGADDKTPASAAPVAVKPESSNGSASPQGEAA